MRTKKSFFFNFVQLLASFVRLIHVKRLKKHDFHHKSIKILTN